MVLLPDHARQRNNFEIIPLARPRIERAVDCGGFYVLGGDHGTDGKPLPSSQAWSRSNGGGGHE